MTQSTFASPCTNLTNADGTVVDSGFQPVAANATSFTQWTFTINNASAPLWFYCRQAKLVSCLVTRFVTKLIISLLPHSHCQAGMVFAINPTADKSFAAFQAKAMGATASASSAGTAASGTAAVSNTVSTTLSPSASTTTANNNGAGALKTSAGVLLTGLGVVAGLVL